MRFHVIALPNSRTCQASSWCAYQSKVLKFCKMMTQRGHRVYHYGVRGSQVVCYEDVPVLEDAEYQHFFGAHDPTRAYSPIQFDASQPYFQLMNKRAADEIRNRAEQKDFVCLIGGVAQRPIAEMLPEMVSVEYGIGYYGTFAKFRVFESYAHMHVVYGKQGTEDGKFFDAVIPNYFDMNDFPSIPINRNPNDVLYLGRMIRRKGLEIAVEAATHAGKRLVLAGQGVKTIGGSVEHPGKTAFSTEDGYYYSGPHLDFIGTVDVQRRNEVLRSVGAVIMPTLYLEPFGGVAVEAQLCGTPVVTTDWGAFPETVEHGKTGYRCRTMEQFTWALQEAPKLNNEYIAERAKRLYSLERVGRMYEEYFGMLLTLWDKGFYEQKPRSQLNWLEE